MVGASDDAVDPRLRLAYDESVRGWALQSTVLDELRTRAGVLIAAASVSSAFLGTSALPRGGHLNAGSVIAIVGFIAVVGLCVYVVWPAKGWVFVHNAERLITTYLADDLSADDMYRRMTLDNAGYRKRNQARIDRRFLAFRLACMSLGLDVVVWLIVLQGKV